jgi:hypothetical protein
MGEGTNKEEREAKKERNKPRCGYISSQYLHHTQRDYMASRQQVHMVEGLRSLRHSSCSSISYHHCSLIFSLCSLSGNLGLHEHLISKLPKQKSMDVILNEPFDLASTCLQTRYPRRIQIDSRNSLYQSFHPRLVITTHDQNFYLQTTQNHILLMISRR